MTVVWYDTWDEDKLSNLIEDAVFKYPNTRRATLEELRAFVQEKNFVSRDAVVQLSFENQQVKYKQAANNLLENCCPL
ncbi:unnamed protein product [Didymodactylos carnosus]|uniref:Uncharacterized protein n=1 Tax=Didymodactylos carnosus TaxID=1234261 RepID=A0A815F799_9BILA|nr:unnamed protein product [Didymodactylos carnosus]CAF4169478.1 unnamed protein product [Didymodactylos carnosus]